MEYKEPKAGVILYDVSESCEEISEKLDEAHEVIREIYPNVHIFPSAYYGETKMGRVGNLIRQLGKADTLFCNTCGDEVDHLYRFIRAIAKNEGLQIIPMRELRERHEANTRPKAAVSTADPKD